MTPVTSYTLRLSPKLLPDRSFEITRVLVADGQLHVQSRVTFKHALTGEELGDVYWYHEDFPLYPVASAVRIAGLVERRAALAGTALHQALFVDDASGAQIWSLVAPELHRTRIEVEVNSEVVDAYPWELIRAGPDTPPLAVVADAFVRVHSISGQTPSAPTAEDDRVLLVICRPDASTDVPFRSVASSLLRQDAIAPITADVLRPPTFENLRRVLQEAHALGRPYRVVHFDGHGEYTDLFDSGEERGYLMFEDPAAAENRALINGTKLGTLLAQYGVHVLVVNACRSAHVGVIASPDPDDPSAAAVSAYGSLASEVIRAGVPGVVAMRYNVWVETAAAFTAALYAALGGGTSLGTAVRTARQHLFSGRSRNRNVIHAVQDWQVPVVYEPQPVQLRLASRRRDSESVSLHGFPHTPPSGYVGLDAVILAIDRAFDQDRVVLLHGPAGSGKTGALAEYASWAAATRAPIRAALYQSLSACRSVGELIDAIGSMVSDPQRWNELGPVERREVLEAKLQNFPLLLVLDDADRVDGTLPGREAMWSQADRQRLAGLIQQLSAAGSQILVGSRVVKDWIRMHPDAVVLRIPSIVQSERYVLLRHLAPAVTNPTYWDPLLELADGNGLGVVALVELALATGVESRRATQDLVDRIRDGELTWADGMSRQHVRALEQELSEALERFEPRRRSQLALLTFVSGLFTETTVRYLGQSDRPWAVEEIAGISAIDLVALLDEFAETGWLRPLPGNSFLAHPLLPLLLRPHLEHLYGHRVDEVERAFVEVMAAMGVFVESQGSEIWNQVMEHELLDMRYALHLAIAHGSWRQAVSIMRAIRRAMLNRLHESDWTDLVEAVSPMFMTDDGAPLPGREPYWVVVLDYRIEMAEAHNAFGVAEQLANECCRQVRRLRSETGDSRQHLYWTAWLAAVLLKLGRMRQAVADPACLQALREAYGLYTDQDQRLKAAECARNLAEAYSSDADYHDDEQAEVWIQRVVALVPDNALYMAAMATLRSLLERRPAEDSDAHPPDEPKSFETREERAEVWRVMPDELRDEFRFRLDLANELPLPSRRNPNARMNALQHRAHMRLFVAQDERGYVDYLEALQIAHDMNDLIGQAQVQLELARETYCAHRLDRAAVYAAAAVEHFARGGRRGAAGEKKARALLDQIDGKDDRT